jgi:hypothetical protein
MSFFFLPILVQNMPTARSSKSDGLGMEWNTLIFFFLYRCTALWTLATFFRFLILYTVGRTFWTGDQPVARPLPTHTPTQTE